MADEARLHVLWKARALLPRVEGALTIAGEVRVPCTVRGLLQLHFAHLACWCELRELVHFLSKFCVHVKWALWFLMFTSHSTRLLLPTVYNTTERLVDISWDVPCHSHRHSWWLLHLHCHLVCCSRLQLELRGVSLLRMSDIVYFCNCQRIPPLVYGCLLILLFSIDLSRFFVDQRGKSLRCRSKLLLHVERVADLVRGPILAIDPSPIDTVVLVLGATHTHSVTCIMIMLSVAFLRFVNGHQIFNSDAKRCSSKCSLRLP